jgi:hypothetical protein
MKRKTCVVLLTLSSGLLMVFGATVDKCQEKFESCKVTCGNEKAQCKARGGTIENCEKTEKMCLSDCDKALEKCHKK